MKCKYCGNLYNNMGGYVNHIKTCEQLDFHKLSIIDDYNNGISAKKLSDKYHINKNNIIKMLKSIEILRTVSDSLKLYNKKYPHKSMSDSTKQKIRLARLNYMKNNPHNTAWRKRNLPSYPEKLFMKMCKELHLTSIYDIEREYPMYPFYIDFAFINARVAIEIDGSQHWLNEDRNKQDRKKEDVIKSNKWRLMRIPEFKLKQNWDEIKTDLLSFLSSATIYEKNYNDDIYHHQEIKRIKQELHKANQKELNDTFVLNRKKDFDEVYPSHGWSVKLGEKWNMTSQAASRYCKKYFNIGNIHNIITKEDIMECFGKKMSINSIGSRFNLSSSTISNYCKKYKIDIPEPIYKVDWTLIDLKTLLKTKTISMIAHDLNVTYTSVRNRAKKLGII